MAEEKEKASVKPEDISQKASDQKNSNAGVTPEDIAKAIVYAKMAEESKEGRYATTPGMDKTVPGGRYIVNGMLVNAEGKPIK